MTTKKRDYTRRSFSKLGAAGAVVSASSLRCARPVAAIDPIPEDTEQSITEQRDNWMYSGPPEGANPTLSTLPDRARRVDWGHQPVPAPSKLRERAHVELSPQVSLSGNPIGVTALSQGGVVGTLDRKCRGYRKLGDGVSSASSLGAGELVACVTQAQRVRLHSLRDEGGSWLLRDPEFLPESAAQVWRFAGFVLVAHTKPWLVTHFPPPPIGLTLYSVSLHQRSAAARARGLEARIVASLDTSRHRLRVAPSADGFTMVRNYGVEWHDWRFRQYAEWFDEDDLTAPYEPVAIATSGDTTHVLYRGQRSWLFSFPRPGHLARHVELPFDVPAPSPLEWTQWEPPWRDRSSPSACEAWTPLPGPDGRVALAPPGHILCYDGEGNVAWQFKRDGAAPARLVDGGLLVEHDASLFVLDWNGTFNHVWTAAAPLTARPLFHRESWYVATQHGVHRLT